MNTIIALVMGLAIAVGGTTETTTIVNVDTGTKIEITETISGGYVEEYEYNYETNEWELIEEA